MTSPAIRIQFKLKRGVLGDVFEQLAFWDAPSTIQWFHEQGYVLYKRYLDEYGVSTDMSIPTIPCGEQVEADYPYAHYDTNVTDEMQVPLRAFEMQGKVGFAQDLLNRHVAIKIVPADTEEFKILDFLRQQKLETLKENCVIPVLDILPIDGFYFVVMPRWGSKVHTPWPQSVREMLVFIHSMLKGLNFLHKHNITHGDINPNNILVDQFDDAILPNERGMRADLRSKGCLLYALFDFDFSIKLPPESDRMRHRIPADISWGTSNITTDTAQGEPDFNPFVTDVGSLGVLFSRYYQHLTQEVPLLAPFLDKLTTHNLPARFTADEALLFFEDNFLQLSTAELDQRVYLPDIVKLGNLLYYEYDRWANVSPEFAQKWAHYRVPPIPWTTSLLRKICRTRLGSFTVYWVRWLFSLRHRSFL